MRDAEPARLLADWPAPPGVVAFSTVRTGPGASAAPFDRFNLGLRSGDDPAAAQANRRALHAAIGTPHGHQRLHVGRHRRLGADGFAAARVHEG